MKMKMKTSCRELFSYLDDIDGNIARLLGSSEHDGFIAEESMYYPKSAHSNVLVGPNSKNGLYTRFDEFNHLTISPFGNPKVREEIRVMNSRKEVGLYQ